VVAISVENLMIIVVVLILVELIAVVASLALPVVILQIILAM